MIRCVRISADDQVIPETPCFAWFNTVVGHFLEFSQEQVWATWDDFERDWRDDDEHPHKHPLERFRGLFSNARSHFPSESEVK